MNEETRKMIDEWHASDQHQDIIDTLERIPDKERDFEIIGILARAYNNVEEYARAIELLESVKEKGKDDFAWNFRIGYAYYYQDRLDEALACFKKARELNEEDEYTKDFIRLCNKELPLSKRVERFWDWFVSNEKELSERLHPSTQEEADDFIAFVGEGTGLISKDMHFNLGGDHEFTFSVEGWPDLFIIYPYIISCMPECLKSKWRFFPFNQGTDVPFGLRMYGADIDCGKIMVKTEYLPDNNCFNLFFFEKNLCALPKEASNNAFWVILENILGEGLSFKYIDRIEPLEEPEEGMIPLPALRHHIKETVEANGQKYVENPKDLYSTYRLEPKESDELRFDVIIGSTCLGSLLSEYYGDSTELFDHINSFGASALYIAFPNGDVGDEILNLRHDIEDRISDEILKPLNIGQIIGGATGTNCSYIDLIVYDEPAFLDKVVTLLEGYPTFSFYVSDFRRNAEVMQLTELK